MASKITQEVALAIYRETGKYFKGVMYGGFIATKNGVKLIEYNARFGDPEAMNALVLLKTDLIDICEAIIEQRLSGMAIEFEKMATVCKYVVPEGYPENSVKDKEIVVKNLDEYKLGTKYQAAGLHKYYASVNDNGRALVLCGSRAIAFVGVAETIEQAGKLAQQGVESVEGPVFYRTDIGSREIIDQKVEMMQKIREHL